MRQYGNDVEPVRNMSWIKLIENFKNFVLDLLFPIECFGCGREGTWICDNCLNLIPPQTQYFKTNYLDRVLFYSSHDNELLKELIHAFKYKYIQDLAEPLARLMFKAVIKVNLPENFLLVPVPLHKKRLKERGFNQSELLAQALSQKIGGEVINALNRCRNVRPQVTLKETERKENVLGAFICSEPLKIKNQNIILIDDVVTTGATMEECAKILKENGASYVCGVAVAKG